MPDICVVHISDDRAQTEQLVTILRQRWDVWWDGDIKAGHWDVAAQAAIGGAKALVPVFSRHCKPERISIMVDEMSVASKANVPIFPFLISPADLPLGYRRLNYTKAFNWDGRPNHPGCTELISKLGSKVGVAPIKGGVRPRELRFGAKKVRTPVFAFSLSSHETQITPIEGAELLNLLQPSAALVSAYDLQGSGTKAFGRSAEQLARTKCALYLDSGNYEADRKDDHYSAKKNPHGWQRKQFWKAARALRPDVAFTFDNVGPRGSAKAVASLIVRDYRTDDAALGKRSFALAPIVHLPRDRAGHLVHEAAPEIVSMVAETLDPALIAIPERELGDGLLNRTKAVRQIRAALNAQGKYYPLHLLGTGNPLSMLALAAAGADSFDGLEWCRTVADFETGFLFHFQQFDFFSVDRLSRVKDPRVRAIIQDAKAPYDARVACYNVDFFNGWIAWVQDMIHLGQVEHSLRMIPNIGPQIFEALST